MTFQRAGTHSDDNQGNSRQLSSLLKLAANGNEDAYGEVIAMASDRLVRLARRMLARFPDLKRWEQTDDVVQNASIRLHRSLAKVQPDSMARFVGLASTEIRRTLIDLVRHHFGPEGQAAHYRSHPAADDSQAGKNAAEPAAGTAGEPESLDAWTRFHTAVGDLPEEERQVFELVWFSGLEQSEISSLTGLSLRSVKRRWRAAKLRLYDALEGNSPLATEW